MTTYKDKIQNDKSKEVKNTTSQHHGVDALTSQFVDNRPEAVAQEKLQDLANNNPKQQLIQKKANPDSVKGKNKTGLPDDLKSGIENLSGYSMDDVKVHYNSDKPAQLQAHAYAQGTDIHLASGQEKHLSHEAWHVVQQKQGRVKPTLQKPALQMKDMLNINDDAVLEKEADSMGKRAAQWQTPHVSGSTKNQGTKISQLRGMNTIDTTQAIQRVLDTSLENYKDVVAKYPDAETAKGQCHNAAIALKGVARSQKQEYNFIWAWCEDLVSKKFGGMEDHVALESGGTVYDLTLQQFPDIVGPWVGSVAEWKKTLLAAYAKHMRTDEEAGHFTVSFKLGGSYFDNFNTPEAADVLGVFDSPAPSGCCFITTACTEYMGLSDDCEELTILRKFRDQHILKKQNGSEMVDLYYDHAPNILNAIRQREDIEEILRRLYAIILKCVNAIKKGDNKFAFDTYFKMVLELKETYCPREQVVIPTS